jgi:DNA helicase II / ATP-dependent DNA helicase PcrA
MLRHSSFLHRYQLALRKSNSLDFDDLLVYGVKLFEWNDGQLVKWCKHVLVDELQVSS